MNAEWYWRDRGQVSGPVTYAVLQGLAQSRQLTGSMEVRQGSAGAWMFAGQVKGLFQAGAPAQAAAPALHASPEDPPRGASGSVGLGLSFIVADSFLTGLVATLAGVGTIIFTLIMATGWYFLLGVVLLTVAACCFLLSYGLITQQRWAGYLLLATYAMHVVVGIVLMIVLFKQLEKLTDLKISSTGLVLGIVFSMVVAVGVLALAVLGPLRNLVRRP